MAQIDFQRREIAVKLVYYGPALSGKTTNLQALHERMDPRKRAHLVSLDTKDDRTLFFDLLPLSVKSATGVTVKVKLFTVPGQVMHNTTRRVVLQGCDGVVFVADSRVSETTANNEAFVNLKQNLRENGIDPGSTPIVIQFNKRDLPGIRSDADLARIAARGKEPVYAAVAMRGEGVVETFLGLANAVWESLEKKLGIGTTHGVGREELIGALAAQLGVAPTVPAGLGGQK
jgi:signal recognition particle receptor subunit beta